MKVTLHMDGERTRDVQPSGDGRFATAAGACPCCKADPFDVHGTGMTRGGPDPRRCDRYTSPAVCLACRVGVGTLVAEMDTLFGLAEDEAVLEGRPRVYR